MRELRVAEQLAELKILSKRMTALLENDEQGLTSWWLMLAETIKRIAEIGKAEGL